MIFTPGVFSEGEKSTFSVVVLSVSIALKKWLLHAISANQLNRDCSLVTKLCQIHTMC